MLQKFYKSITNVLQTVQKKEQKEKKKSKCWLHTSITNIAQIYNKRLTIEWQKYYKWKKNKKGIYICYFYRKNTKVSQTHNKIVTKASRKYQTSFTICYCDNMRYLVPFRLCFFNPAHVRRWERQESSDRTWGVLSRCLTFMRLGFDLFLLHPPFIGNAYVKSDYNPKTIRLTGYWIRANVCQTIKKVPVPAISSDLSKYDLNGVRLIERHLYRSRLVHLNQWSFDQNNFFGDALIPWTYFLIEKKIFFGAIFRLKRRHRPQRKSRPWPLTST